MKDPKNLYKDLEEYSKQAEARGDTGYNEPIRAIRVPRQRHFPVNKILIVIAVVGLGYYLQGSGGQPRNPKAEAVGLFSKFIDLVTGNTTTFKIIGEKRAAKLIEMRDKFVEHEATNAATPKSPQDSAAVQMKTTFEYTATDSSSNGAAMLATADDFKSGQFVQINGRYYKYRSDNVYWIGGQKIFYKSNRKVVEAAPAAPKESVEK